MNSKVFKYVSLGIGCLIALVALLNLIAGILHFTDIDSDAPAQYNIYVIILAIVSIGFAAVGGFIAYVLINDYLKDNGKSNIMGLFALAYGCVQALISIAAFALARGYEIAIVWVVFVIAIAVIVGFFVAKTQTDEKTKYIAYIVTAGIGFVLSTIKLSNNGGIGLACDLFSMFTMMGIAGYYVLKLIPTTTSNEPKQEAKPEVKEEPKEEAKPEVKEEPKEEVKPEVKEEPKEEAKPEVKEEPKEEKFSATDKVEAPNFNE